MSNISILFRREFSSFFATPVAYARLRPDPFGLLYCRAR